jgi:short subunit dehydrogenase-like uncharacterized protein
MSEKTHKTSREYDVVVWGATGFVGRLISEYMARINAPVRWAMGGRSRAKLERVRAEIAEELPSISRVPLLEANADDAASIEALAAKTHVVATTVGPYGLYGKNLVGACVRQGTDYCDLTGEVTFVRWAIDEFHDAAKNSGTRIVPTCGFDSIPSDLGVFFLAEQARQRGKKLAEVRGFVVDAKGGMSGGTVASIMLMSELIMKDPSAARLMADPYSLSPDRARDLNTDEPDRFTPRFDATLDAWGAPWMMAGINMRIVRRSNALFDHAYGRHFRYTEELRMPGGRLGFIPGVLATGAMGLGFSLLAIPPVKKFIATKVPAPGEGPSKEARERGRFALRFLGRVEGDEAPTLAVRVTGRGDPGYLATSRMIAQAAMCLASDPPQPGFEGGVLTPATAMGMHLIERLRNAEMTFEVESIR